MEMPEGWNRLCWHRDGFKDRDLTSMAMTFTEAADLMKEMAEALEYFRLQALESEHPCKDKNLACWHILNKFKSWK